MAGLAETSDRTVCVFARSNEDQLSPRVPTEVENRQRRDCRLRRGPVDELAPRNARHSTGSATRTLVRRGYVRTSSRNAGDAVIRRSAPRQQQQQLYATAIGAGRCPAPFSERAREGREDAAAAAVAVASRLTVINHRAMRSESADFNGIAARQSVNYYAHALAELILGRRRRRGSLTCAASLNNSQQPTINSVPPGALSFNRP